MALLSSVGQRSGPVDAMSVTVTVWDDAAAEITESQAVDRAQLDAPADFFGIAQDTTPSVEQLSPYAYDVTINYRYRQLTSLRRPVPPEMGTLTIDGGPYEVKPKFMTQFLAPLGVYDSSGDVTSLYEQTKWLINPTQPGRVVSQPGATIQPFTRFFTYNYFAPNADITDSYVKAVSALIAKGACNDDVYLDQPAGCLQLVMFDLAQRTPDDWTLRYVFGVNELQTSVEISGGIVIPELKGNSYYWTLDREVWNATNKITETQSIFAVVGQVWPEDDYTTILDLPGVT